MGVIRKIALAVLFISAVTFVALFGRLPALRKTPIGLLQRVLCVHIPKGLKAVDQRVTGGWTTVKGRKLGRYLFYEQNPVVLVRRCILYSVRPSTCSYLVGSLPGSRDRQCHSIFVERVLSPLIRGQGSDTIAIGSAICFHVPLRCA